ncbi:MAG: NlpC/P60 family protein [Proteiniphilum sp.]|jgi:lipoprotein Spr|nr:NlpC/P60 family protein [Proteiniphilum sp.]MDD2936848.1 NlpC/P60 family protein [Proteiniphilum sp.]MDD3076515.1 NlpC/P60 family protein [Proteiniphilum sp.]MDD3779436.1 NlpC/P60 family protein [Proteiniphilum sp.]MDD3954825.1 NlpC/P60 family protein [Proteiniphilum sp.]
MIQPNKSSASYLRGGLFQVASCFIISVLLVSCNAGRSSVSRSNTTSSTSANVLNYGSKYLGKPYRSGGKGPQFFDCSGYTAFVFGAFGYKLGSSSADQEREVPLILDRKKLQKGDLVFFEGRTKNGKVGHVGIVSTISPNGDFEFIHASTTSGVIVSSSKEPYYASRYLRGGRVLEENSTQHAALLSSATTKKRAQPVAIAVGTTAVLKHAEHRKGEVDSVTKEPAQTNYLPKKGSVILVQTDSTKNHMGNEKSQNQSREKNKKKVDQVNSDVVLREDEFTMPSPTARHTIKRGETLYSISKQYGCTVEQLKSMNPHLGVLLRTGEVLHIPVTP